MTPQEKKLHDFLWDNRGGVTPSFTEMAEYMGLAAKSGVSRILDSLEAQGLVKRSESGSRVRTLTVMPPPGDLATYATPDLLGELGRRGFIVMQADQSIANAQANDGR